MAHVEPINNYGTYTRSGSVAASSSRRPAAEQAGRYDRRSHNTRAPSEGLARMPVSRNADTAIVAVQDPWGDGRERVLATVNRRVDILEHERSHGLISVGAYNMGRLIQAVLERLGKVAGSNWCGASRIDASMAQELNIVRSLDSAEKIQAWMEDVRGRIGMIDARLLRRVLGDRMSYADCAALQGKAGERGKTYVATRFREALEDLAGVGIAKGKVSPPPDDKHAAAAENVVEREAASMKGGATTERRKREGERR